MSQQDDLELGDIKEEVPSSKQFDDIVTSTIEQFEVLDVLDPETTMLIQANQPMLPNIIYQIVCPEPLVLAPNIESAKKRGRPRKSEIKAKPIPEPPEPPQKPKIMSKTRSGREVKLPRHIQNDFESVEIDNNVPKIDIKKENEVPIAAPVHVELQQKKRKIASQYRCPKCQKAYLGKNKMLKHLQKYPSHGPVTQKQQNDFEVWNHLVSVTQKCPSSERGSKFCQELSNLLHNLLFLTNALFKKVGNNNEVEIDKVLGNAVGLSPGSYYFDDSRLCKDVAVLQLMENSEFLTKKSEKVDKSKPVQVEFADYEMKNDFSLNNYIDEPPPQSKIDILINPVDELMLPVSPAGHHIMDNSSSSDEVLNVDQFVNERFRKITENNLEETSLLSELPPLELFQFHNT
ncbi:unnamed protein product [Ceutorhynchus assimilis]|uniref:C2H2-type domain-containing protein n=1 Tax=Ceutorhynchus assimilis TaxID=467358 RepID=A0A9N9MXE1_9CUCU|nr:unnamed protein product [Ceutorhynchus assimilis]